MSARSAAPTDRVPSGIKNPVRLTSSRRRTTARRSEEHTSELQSQSNLVCRLLLEKKKKIFLYLWLSGLVSTFGCFFSQLAITSLIEHGDYAGSGTAISGIFLASCLPSIVLMLLTG